MLRLVLQRPLPPNICQITVRTLMASAPREYTRKIFQTWKTCQVPSRWQTGQKSVIDMNPGWVYTLTTDADNDELVARHVPWFLDRFRGFEHPIQRADAVRYVILYLYGGVYVDLDYECLRPFDALQHCDMRDETRKFRGLH